jgi:integrase/recombinase XerC
VSAAVLESTLTLADLAAMLRAAVRDGKWGRTPIGEQVDAYLDALEYADAATNTMLAYTHVLGLFAVEHADLSLRDLEPPQGGGVVRAFLDLHWSEKSPATRRHRLVILRSFLTWLVGEGLIRANPATNIRPPKQRDEERNAHPPEEVRALIYAQSKERDRVCLMLLGWLGLRKDELRQLRVGDVDLLAGRVLVHGKGGKIASVPIGYKTLWEALYGLLADRDRDEYLLYPRSHRGRPMDPASIHRWWSRCLVKAGLQHFPMHELRHSAAQALYEETGDPVLAQMLLRHADIRTTRGYLHPSLDRLEAGMEAVEASW